MHAHDTPQGPLYENIMSSTKLEVYNNNARGERVMGTYNALVKFGYVVFEICESTDTHAHHNNLYHYWGEGEVKGRYPGVMSDKQRVVNGARSDTSDNVSDDRLR